MRPSSDTFINSAEASYIAGVSDRDFNRAIDENIVPDLLVQMGPRRRVPRLASAFVSFYFGTESLFSAQWRKAVLSTITGRLEKAERTEAIWQLDFYIEDPRNKQFFLVECKKPMPLTLDISDFIEDARKRARQVDKALEQVSSQEEILGGTPVFKGTRVPIESVLASLDAGVEFGRLKDSYDFLTPELVEAARTYARVRPRRGRPRRLSEIHPNWKLISSKVLVPKD